MRIFGLVVVVLLAAGCGVRDAPAQAPPGSLEAWTERMREAGSVRFDAEFKSEGRQAWWWTRKGEMSPLSKGMHTEGTPEPTQRMVERVKSHYSEAVLESVAIERFSREIYLQDTRLTLPQGKRWVKLDLSTFPNVERDVVMTFNDLHPGSVFIDLDPSTLVISPGTDDQGVWRYELTAAANVESNPNTARKKPVEATVWVNHDGLPVKVEQRSTGDDGNRNTKVTKFSDWDSTPPVELPPAAEIADAKSAKWTDRW